jgi:hypothetical protein
MRILETLAARWGLRVSDRQRSDLTSRAKWGSLQGDDAGLHLLLNDPAAFAILCSNKQRHRRGSMCLSLHELRNVRAPVHNFEDWFAGVFNCRLHPQSSTAPMREDSTYVVFERISTLNRWLPTVDDRYEVLRMRLIQPVRISPRVRNVYGHEVVIEQPMVPRYLAREGWRCWVSRYYRDDKPGSKIGLIDVSDTNQVFRVEGFHDGHTRPFPFIINWCMDSSEILERVTRSRDDDF